MTYKKDSFLLLCVVMLVGFGSCFSCYGFRLVVIENAEVDKWRVTTNTESKVFLSFTAQSSRSMPVPPIHCVDYMWLDCGSCSITDFSCLTNIRISCLSLNCADSRVLPLAQCAVIPGLREFHLDADECDLSFVSNMTHLVSFDVLAARVTSLEMLGRLVELKKLRLFSGEPLRHEQYGFLRSLRSLCDLDLDSLYELDSLAVLGKMPALTNLNVEITSITNVNLQEVKKQFPSLQRIQLSGFDLIRQRTTVRYTNEKTVEKPLGPE